MKKIIKRIIIAIVIISLVGLGVLTKQVYDRVFSTIGRIDHEGIVTIDPENEDFETTTLPAGQTTKQDVAEKIENYLFPTVEPIDHSPLMNILIVGQDQKPEDNTRQRSDVMMLCSYNRETNEVHITSFLRDLYVKLPGGYSHNKLNAAYHFGGFKLLYQTMLDNFGVKIDGGIEIDFNGFVDIVDLLGGVDMYLTAEEAPYVSSTATEGVNHLNGRKALNYARTRKTDDDFGRTERQRKMLVALFEKVRHADLDTINELINTALSMVKTDMTDETIASLIAALLPKISTLEITTHCVPSKGNFMYGYARGMQVLIPDNKKIRDTIEAEYLPFSDR
jgi:LCP family protein required for cell wall assembly